MGWHSTEFHNNQAAVSAAAIQPMTVQSSSKLALELNGVLFSWPAGRIVDAAQEASLD